ncbi:MAG: YggS family pyridoxal phosphate-dependent enzyme [Micrococcus sp.]|nr:YggS family pyridoxal phosphate-dependent enzyme [Micrococcus sp.]
MTQPEESAVHGGGASHGEDAAQRREDIAEGLRRVSARIEAAVAATPGATTPQLIAVTKTHPAADVVELARLGVAHVGENRDQEARPKAAEVERRCIEAGLTPPAWHFIGQLQTNKAKYVVRYARTVHGVDRADLVDALERAQGLRLDRGEATDDATVLGCLVQVDLDPRPLEQRPPGIGARGGVAPEHALELAAAIDQAPHLALRGLMCVAPRGREPEEAFARLAQLSHQVQARWPQASWRSMGMSGDLEAAVRQGATHLRIGSDLLGRAAPVG